MKATFIPPSTGMEQPAYEPPFPKFAHLHPGNPQSDRKFCKSVDKAAILCYTK